MDQIRVVFLGTGAGCPSRYRNVASLAVVLDGHVLLFDCGEGTQHQLLRSGVRSGHVEAIFITHMHGDHIYGLPGLLATLSLEGRTEPLTVCGPPDLAPYLEAVSTASRFQPGYPLRVIAGEYRGDGFRVIAAPLEHTIECFGYCLIERDRPGRFDIERARALGVPEGPLFGRLQRGEDIAIGGRSVRSRDVVGETRRGRRIAYCSDTRPCPASSGLSRDADLLIHEATYANDMAAEARERGHSTAEEAARVALEAGVRELALTHISSRYENPAPLLSEARTIFPSTTAAADFGVMQIMARSVR